MSGMIPGVGVPHRRRLSHRVNSYVDDPSYLGERSSDSSMDLSETTLRARQRLEKKLSSCLYISPRSKSKTLTGKLSKINEKHKWGSSKSANIHEVDESNRNVCSCC